MVYQMSSDRKKKLVIESMKIIFERARVVAMCKEASTSRLWFYLVKTRRKWNMHYLWPQEQNLVLIYHEYKVQFLQKKKDMSTQSLSLPYKILQREEKGQSSIIISSAFVSYKNHT